MSRLWTCASSCASTPRSSRSVSRPRIPSVQQTAALRGLRPVANALGAAVGDTYSAGIGAGAAVESSRTIRYSPGASTSLTGRARMERSAIVALLKYAKPFTPRATTSAIARPVLPAIAEPATRISADSNPSRAAVFRPLRWRCMSRNSVLQGSGRSPWTTPCPGPPFRGPALPAASRAFRDPRSPETPPEVAPRRPPPPTPEHGTGRCPREERTPAGVPSEPQPGWTSPFTVSLYGA